MLGALAPTGAFTELFFALTAASLTEGLDRLASQAVGSECPRVVRLAYIAQSVDGDCRVLRMLHRIATCVQVDDVLGDSRSEFGRAKAPITLRGASVHIVDVHGAATSNGSRKMILRVQIQSSHDMLLQT